MIRALRPVFIAALAWAGFLAGVMPVLADSAPAVELAECYIYGNILDDAGDGDLLVFCRADLPVQSGTSTPVTPEEWCAYLADTDGCTADPVAPTDPTSLTPWAAFLAFYDDAEITLRGVERTPRVDHHLVGVYLGVEHGVTWGDANATVCVETSSTLFDPSATACLTPSWRPTSATLPDTSVSRATLEADLVAVMKNLETVRLQALDTYVSGEKITAEGTDFAREAFSLIHVAAPGAFQAGSTDLSGAGIAPYETPGPGALNVHVAATAAASDLVDALGDASAEWGTGDPELEGRAAIVLAGVVCAALVSSRFRRLEIVLLAFLAPLAVGIYLFIPVDWLIALIGIGLTALVIVIVKVLR